MKDLEHKLDNLSNEIYPGLYVKSPMYSKNYSVNVSDQETDTEGVPRVFYC